MNEEKTMRTLLFTNGEIAYCHIWNTIDLNNSLKNN